MLYTAADNLLCTKLSIPGFDAEVVEGDLGNVMTWKRKKDRFTDKDTDGDEEQGGALPDGRYRELCPRGS